MIHWENFTVDFEKCAFSQKIHVDSMKNLGNFTSATSPYSKELYKC